MSTPRWAQKIGVKQKSVSGKSFFTKTTLVSNKMESKLRLVSIVGVKTKRLPSKFKSREGQEPKLSSQKAE